MFQKSYIKIKRVLICSVVAAGVLTAGIMTNMTPTQAAVEDNSPALEQEVSSIVEDVQEKKEAEDAQIKALRRQEMDAVKEVAAEKVRKEAEEQARIAAEQARVAKRQEIVDFAVQFVGNPYVYGGTSLTNGADCSGFVMSVFANFGYSLPRVASDQAYAGTPKSVEQLEPGDLVFYGGGSINHVALYIGNGQIVHASTAATGIKISNYDYQQPCMAATYVA